MNTVSDIASSLYGTLKHSKSDFIGESIISGIIDYTKCESVGQGDLGYYCIFEDWKITDKTMKVEDMIVNKRYNITITDDYFDFLQERFYKHNSGPRIKVKLLFIYRASFKSGKFCFFGNMIEDQDFNSTIQVDF